MRCLKVKFIGVVLIFIIVVGVYFLFLYLEGDERIELYLMLLFLRKWWLGVKLEGEMWIFGKFL